MPAAAWPGTVHRKANLPAFGSATRNVAVWFRARLFVFLPAILKSCLTDPRFVTLKTAVPFGTVFFESVN
jgi:hypothetical protein